MSSLAFENWLLDAQTGAPSGPLSDAEWAEFQGALDQDPRTATRAVLVLAHSGDERVPTVLLERLEQRVIHSARADDSGDCTAAAALGRLGDPQLVGDRLVDLVHGERPHPDLEVRTECALGALSLGRREVVPYLLRVLRIDTPSAEREGRLTDSDVTAWPRGRAAKALHDLAGWPYSERTDASVAEREELADRLSQELIP